MFRLNRFLLVGIGVLLLVATGAVPLRAQTDVIRGRVTGVDGVSLIGVRVTATSIPGNVTRSTNTNGDGRYQIAFPNGPGDYILGFATVGYTFKQFEIKRLADEDVLVADARLAPLLIDTLLVMPPKQERVNRNSPTPDVSGTEQSISNANLPSELRGDIAAMAASLPGVLLVPGLDGQADGFSVLGLSTDQNNVTLNGMQSGSNNLPRDGAYSTSLTTSPYDVSRGGFSGGNFNIRSRSGSNFQTRGASLVTTTPQMQWTDKAAQAIGSSYTNLSLGGLLSGPLKLNKAFYNISYQLGRQSQDNQTLLNTSPLGLQTAGVAADSVTHFVGLLRGYALPLGNTQSNRLSDNGSVFGSIDFAPPGSSSGQALGLTFSGNWRRLDPISNGVSQIASASGQRTNWSGSVQARHSGYLGMLLSETTLGVNAARDYGQPYLMLPGGRVRVNSVFEDGSSGVQLLTFGGNQNLSSSSRTVSTGFQNSLSWFDNGNKHRLKLSSELQYSRNTQNQASNLLGSFYFNSLEDLEANRPASFTRTLSARQRSADLLNGALALGDSYRPSQDLQLQFGVRVDANHFLDAPAYNPLVESTFGRRNDKVPTPVAFSPRIGFSWTVGHAQEIASFVGAAPLPRAVIRGGIGVFANNASSGLLGSALDNTGLPNGTTQIVCVGPAAPAADWQAYTASRSNVPNECADGSMGSVFSNGAPNVTLFANNYAPQKTVRSNASWNGNILDGRFSLGVEGIYSLNLNQQRFIDLNFDPTAHFNLSDDGRPVYVAPTSIVPTTGTIGSNDARVSQSFAHVSEMRSDLKSHTAQLSVRLSPIARTPKNFSWNLGYTYSRIREQASGFSNTAGDPRTVEWTRAQQGLHQINYGLTYRFFEAVNVSWSGSFRSGLAFTPMVAGDINGDGYANDRAFVYSPATSDAAIASGMQQLLANSSGATRDCLEKQMGAIAARNSCHGPWTSNAWLNVTLDRAKFHMPQRGEISFSLSNPLGAADLLVNGSDHLKGWGQTAYPDQSLLYVRGFDAASRQYRYEVNQRFGATRPQFTTMRSPATLTATIRFDLGPTRERQQLAQQLASGRKQPGSQVPEQLYRAMTAGNIGNPLSAILRSQDTLQLSARQADSIAAMNRRYTYRADSLWAPVAHYWAQLPKQYSEDEAYNRYINARHAQIDMLSGMVDATRDLLTDKQRRKLPSMVTNLLDARYLALIRNGTPMFLSSGGGLSPMMVGDMMFMGGTFNMPAGAGTHIVIIRQ